MAAIIAGVSILAIAFMAFFLVKICTEGSRVKLCEIVHLDTESCAPPDAAPQAASNILVMPRTPYLKTKHRRGRKPA